MKALHDIKGNLNGVQVEVTVIKHIMFPEWLMLALKGSRYDAIKELRDNVGKRVNGVDYLLSMPAAMKVIDSIIDEITPHDSAE